MNVTLDTVVSYIVSLGTPGVILFLIMGIVGPVGAAAFTTALAWLGGPLGMFGGVLALLFIGRISHGISKFGYKLILKKILEKREERGEAVDELFNDIDKMKITKSLKLELKDLIKTQIKEVKMINVTIKKDKDQFAIEKYDVIRVDIKNNTKDPVRIESITYDIKTSSGLKEAKVFKNYNDRESKKMPFVLSAKEVDSRKVFLENFLKQLGTKKNKFESIQAKVIYNNTKTEKSNTITHDDYFKEYN